MEKRWEQAAQAGDEQAARRMIGEGVEVNAKDRYGQTTLMIAAIRGHTELVRLLVQSGAELNTTAKYHLSALMLAVINGHAEIVRILAEAGADAQIRGTGAPGFWGKTALDLASEGAGKRSRQCCGANRLKWRGGGEREGQGAREAGEGVHGF
jgi:ankyrin repeat protein